MSNNVDEFIKDFGLEVSGGDFTEEQYAEAKTKLNTLIEQRVVDARIDELERINGDCLICSDSRKRNDGTFRGQNYEKRLAQLQAQQDKEQA